MDDREERIRAKAYELWQEAGQPEGREVEHWEEAERMINAQDTDGETDFGVNPEQTGPAQPDQIETVEAEVPVKRKKKASARPSRKPSDTV